MSYDLQQGFRLGPWTIEPLRGAVTGTDDQTQHLKPKVMDVFVCLAEHSNKLVSRDQLLESVWSGHVAADELLTGAVSDLRRVLQDDRGDPQYLETVPKRGYRLIKQVRPLGDTDSEENAPSSSASAAMLQTRHRTLWAAGFALVVVVAVLTGLNVGGMRDRLLGVATPKLVKSIAVLPFVNLSSDQEQEWFADGLTEEILNSLSMTPDLLVTARTSSFAFKDSSDDVPTIAATLGVDHILEGSVRRGADRLRITVQLIRAEDGFHLWSETFDRTPDDIIAIQEEIAIEIASALETAMDPEALAEMMSVDTRSVPAYEAYLTGNGLWLASDDDIYLRLDARDAYEEAVALDPEFTRAYDRLFWFWQQQLHTNNVSHRLTGLAYEEISRKRDEALNNAIRSEKDTSTLLKYQSYKAWVEMQPERALRLITEFLEQNPNAQTGRGLRRLLLSSLNMQNELDEIVESAYGQNELKVGQAHRWLDALEFSDNKDLMRTVAHDAIDRFGDSHSILYRAHHVLLNAGDIDGARAILPDILSSNTWKRSHYLAELRQACAELRTTDSARIQAIALQQFPDSLSIKWNSNKIMGNDEAADSLFRKYDESGEFATIYSYLIYPHFDAKLYPNFMRALAGQGVKQRQIVELPYRCNR